MLSLIVLIEDRIETVFKDEHPSKAETPIDVINEGIVILVIFVHSLNDPGPISISDWDNKRPTISVLFFNAAICNAVILLTQKY